MKISLLTPTRFRPHSMERLWNSALETADHPENLEIVFYMDNDDVHSLTKFETMDKNDGDKGRVRGIVGERIVLSEMWNASYKEATGDICMHCGDDIIFRSKGWDSKVVGHISAKPDHIVFVHGMDGIQNERLGTHGFLHRNWIDTLGYFVPPYFSCDYNDTWLTAVGDMLGRRVYDPEIYTEHMHWAVGKQPRDTTYAETTARGNRDNVTALYQSLEPKRKEDADKLRAFITNFEQQNKKETV
jgi:hypothetical protein